mmetsp:Transcript_553/g.1773  ORF Transcript_553/g.1773 Transcript_553/m.1773 type:complete len:288 (-) Transcript_553:19-882(-)
MDRDHGQLHHVGGASLDGRVDSLTFSPCTPLPVVRAASLDLASAARDSADKAIGMDLSLDPVSPCSDALELSEERLLEAFCFCLRYAMPFGQFLVTHAVDYPEARGLGKVSFLRRDLIHMLLGKLRSNLFVNVPAGLRKEGSKTLILTKLRQNPHLNLAVIDSQQGPSPRRDKGLSHIQRRGCARWRWQCVGVRLNGDGLRFAWNALQRWLAATETPSLDVEMVPCGVDAEGLPRGRLGGLFATATTITTCGTCYGSKAVVRYSEVENAVEVRATELAHGSIAQNLR